MPTVSIQSLQLVPIYFYVISNSLCLPWYLKDLWHRKAKGLRSRVRKWWKSHLHSALNGNSSSPRGQIKAPEWRVLQYSHHCSAPDGTRVSCAAKAVAPNRNLPAVSACFMAFFMVATEGSGSLIYIDTRCETPAPRLHSALRLNGFSKQSAAKGAALSFFHVCLQYTWLGPM